MNSLPCFTYYQVFYLSNFRALQTSSTVCHDQLVSWCFEPSRPQKILIRAEHKLKPVSYLFIPQVIIHVSFSQTTTQIISKISDGKPTKTIRETFIKRYIVERTNKAEIWPEEQSEKAENCRENLWTEIQLKGPRRQKHTQEQNKKSGQARLVYVKDINRNTSTRWRNS